MNGHEFVARARKYAKANGLSFRFDSKRGKGSHVKVWVGSRSTVVKHGEIGKGLFAKMLKQLNVSRRDF